MVWRDVSVYSQHLGADVIATPVPVTVQLGTAMRIDTYRPSVQAAATGSTATPISQLALNMAGDVHVLHVQP